MNEKSRFCMKSRTQDSLDRPEMAKASGQKHQSLVCNAQKSERLNYQYEVYSKFFHKLQKHQATNANSFKFHKILP